MANEEPTPDIIISRLPVYLRALQRMSESGIKNTSSQELGERVGISAAQIRKDLSQFGEFGKQGTGYAIPFLIDKLRHILKIDRIWDIAVIGAGDVGHAVVRYQGFSNRGFRIALIFDNDPTKVGTKIGDFTVLHTDSIASEIRKTKIEMAMLTVPASAAQAIADILVEAGVRAILNYAPISLNVPPGVHVQYVDPAVNLQRMTYYL